MKHCTHISVSETEYCPAISKSKTKLPELPMLKPLAMHGLNQWSSM